MRTQPRTHREGQPPRALRLVAGIVMAAAAIVLFIAEKRRPLRTATQEEPLRTVRNLMLGAASMAVVALLQTPVVTPICERVSKRRLGLAQQLPATEGMRDAAAFVLLDYTMYVWHVLTHKVPLLWRFHLVHHTDLDLDTTTALRFHALDMALSIPWRAAQVRFCGASPRALLLWQGFFFVSIMFHHSNLRLPAGFERRLMWLLTTPSMHGIHHSAVREDTDSNWTSGFSWWDWLHGTLRRDVPQQAITIGVPAYQDADELDLEALAALPFIRQRDAWQRTAKEA